MKKVKRNHPLYRIWKGMRARCNAPSYRNSAYQEKQITVCKRWDNFWLFLEDMGDRPNPQHSIDRINNDKGYEPSNCRWATLKQQSSNRGKFNLLYTYNGETKILKDWSKELDINYNTLYGRIFRSKLSFEEAIQDDPFNKLIEYKGEKKTMKEWSEELNIDYMLCVHRKRRGWNPKRIFETPKLLS